MRWKDPQEGVGYTTLENVTPQNTLRELIERLENGDTNDKTEYSTSDNRAKGLSAKWLKPRQRLELDEPLGELFENASNDDREIIWIGVGGLKGGIYIEVRFRVFAILFNVRFNFLNFVFHCPFPFI